MRKSNNGLANLKRLREQALGKPVAKEGTAAPGRPARRNDTPQADAVRQHADPASAGSHTTTSITAEDAIVFRRAMHSVTPLRATARVVLPTTPASSKALLHQRRQRAIGDDSVPPPTVSDQFSPASPDSDDARFVQARHGPGLLRDLKRGKWPMQASLDLHGSTLADARTRLDQFIQSCLTHHLRCVQIVHGKGFGSKDGTPVLKETGRRWLTQYEPVLAYMECTEQHGGAGAVQVLLCARAITPERTS